MKYIKLILAGILVIISSSQSFLYGFLGSMLLWPLYSLGYLAVGLFQRFHRSSVPSQIFTLLYISAPLAAIIVYAVRNGLSHLTLTFYIVFLIALALAFLWEIISLYLVIKEKSDKE